MRRGAGRLALRREGVRQAVYEVERGLAGGGSAVMLRGGGRPDANDADRKPLVLRSVGQFALSHGRLRRIIVPEGLGRFHLAAAFVSERTPEPVAPVIVSSSRTGAGGGRGLARSPPARRPARHRRARFRRRLRSTSVMWLSD